MSGIYVIMSSKRLKFFFSDIILMLLNLEYRFFLLIIRQLQLMKEKQIPGSSATPSLTSTYPRPTLAGSPRPTGGCSARDRKVLMQHKVCGPKTDCHIGHADYWRHGQGNL